jgi:hypothetical protein
MVLGTTTEVEEIAQVVTSASERVPPASDDYRHVYGSGIDLSSAYQTTISCPDRASEASIHVEGFGSNGGSVTVYTLDPDGNRLTSRGPTENAAYQSDTGEDVLVEASITSPNIEIEIAGDGPVEASIYVR